MQKAMKTLDDPKVASVLTALGYSPDTIRNAVNGINMQQREKLLIQQAIPTGTSGTTVPVLLEIGDTTLQVVDRCGNAVFCDQLRPRRIYDIRIHTASKLATVLCRLPSCTTGANPVLNPPTAPTPPAN